MVMALAVATRADDVSDEQRAQLPSYLGGALPDEILCILRQTAPSALVRTVYVLDGSAEGNAEVDAGVSDGSDSLAGSGVSAAGGWAMCVGYHRPHTVQEKLIGFAGDPMLRDVLRQQASIYAQDAMGVVSVKSVSLHGDHAVEQAHPDGEYYRQTTEFTCGAVALLLALSRKGLVPPPTRESELALWREATMLLACEPYGLAVAAVKRGASPQVYVNGVAGAGDVFFDGPEKFFIDAGLSRDEQRRFYHEAEELGVSTHTGAISGDDVVRHVRDGHMVLVLIDEYLMHDEHCAHWVTAVGMRDGALLIEDPWTDSDYGESWEDAHELAVLPDELTAMMTWGNHGLQAIIVL